MNDLERDIRALLEDEVKRAPAMTDPPPRLAREVRRRQLVTGAIAGITALAVIVGSFLGIHALLPFGEQTRVGAGPTDRTSTVLGVTLTYPSAWMLTERGDQIEAGGGPVGPTGTITGHAVFELNSAGVGVVGSTVYPMSCGTTSGVVLYVQQLRWPRVPGAEPPTWPVPATGHVSDPRLDCGSEWPQRYATWQTNGRIYEAVVAGRPGAVLDRMLQVYTSMRFGPEVGWSGPSGPVGNSISPPYYVLDSGVDQTQHWNLLAYYTTYPIAPTRLCIDLQVNGEFLPAQCDMNVSLGNERGLDATLAVVSDGTSTIKYAWGGGAPRGAISLTPRLSRGAVAVQSIVPLPAAFQVPIDAVLVVASADASGRIDTSTAGHTTGAVPFFLGLTPHVRVPPAGG